MLPEELDSSDPELPPLDAVEDPDPLPPLLVDAPGLLLLSLPEGVDDPDPLLPEDVYTKVVAVEL